ncbi:MAG: hypothetical protein HYS32_02630 [Candidatus Woesearchaeota archaeon]|nr:MAG: hypothetical protein HYS32_02630 [Candidatus Woesearchaeota archaeon]
MALSVIDSILYILVGAIAGMIYSLRRIFILEKKINILDQNIIQLMRRLEREESEELRILRRAHGSKKRRR